MILDYKFDFFLFFIRELILFIFLVNVSPKSINRLSFIQENTK